MVRKVIALLVALVALAVPATAHAAEIYQGTISTTYLTMFRDVVSTLPVNSDYVFYRSGDDNYTLVAGDLQYNGTFSLNGRGKQYVITNESGSGYSSSYYSYKVSDVNSFNLSPGNYLVYSNLGEYPTLEERGVQYEYTQMYIMCAMCICLIIRPVFNFCIRTRSGD